MFALVRARSNSMSACIDAAWYGPWGATLQLVRPWTEIRKAAGLDADVILYALWHSSTVRDIRTRLLLRLVAALHDTPVA